MKSETENSRKTVVISLFFSLLGFFGIVICLYSLLKYQANNHQLKHSLLFTEKSDNPFSGRENFTIAIGFITMDELMTPVPGGIISIGNAQAVSDKNGKFIIEDYIPGEQDVKISFRNRVVHTEKITLSIGLNNVNFHINKIIPGAMAKLITADTPEEDIFQPVAPKVYYRGNPDLKRVAITIDDGWKLDNKLLELFQKYHARFTAFLIGGRGIAEKHQEYITKMDEMGVEVCSHTYTHANLTKLTNEKVREEIRKGQLIISSITGKAYPYMRPSGGSYNKRVLEEVAANGQKIIMWSNTIRDTVKNVKAGDQIKYVMDHLKNGDIILCHFGGYNSYQVLETIIPRIQEQGYELATLSETLEGLDLN